MNKSSEKINNKTILNNVTFNINKGECVALIGPNGAGKTTLMNILLGNLKASYGVITINNLNPDDTKLKDIVGVLPQENSIPSKLTPMELINFKKSISKISLSYNEIDKLLDFSKEKKKVISSKLSGGQRRLLSFILTLISKPKILFLDEPTAAMDTSTRIKFWEIIKDLKKQGVTIVYSSHYIEEVEHTADRILVLNNGELIRDTTPYAMRAEKIEKNFAVPGKFLNIIENNKKIYDVEMKKDILTFVTLDANNIWNLLQSQGCTIDEIEIKNRTLLDSIFTDTNKNKGEQ